MRILVVCQHFYPETFRISTIVEELVKFGHEVVVLTGYPNYPQGDIYEGYGFDIPYNDNYHGAKIVRVKARPRLKGKINLARNYYSFFRLANKWVKKHAKDFDVLYSCQLSPVSMSYPCVIAKKKFNIPYVINVQDLWPESFSEITGIKNKKIIWPLYKFSNNIYKNADYILCASNAIKEQLERRGINQKYLKFWPQFSPKINVSNAVLMPQEFKTKYKFIFTGNVGEAQGLDVVIKAAILSREENEIGYYIIGDGSDKERLKLLANENKLNNVFFIDKQPELEIPKYLKHANAALLTLKDGILSQIVLPAKLQTYMACGTPIICTISGEAGVIVEKSKTGIVCENTGEALYGAVKQIIKLSHKELEEMKINGIQFNNLTFNINYLMEQLNNVLIMCSENKNCN